MKTVLQIISAIALLVVLVPACLYLAGSMDKPAMQAWMLAGTVLWFVSAPFWMGMNKS